MASAAGRKPASLDYRTLLAQGRWRFVLYPDAGEAIGVFQSAAGFRSGFANERPSPGDDRSADRRAKRKIKLYCASNRLGYLWDTTYAGDGQHDHRKVRADIREFFRKLRELVGRPFPYLWVTEWHKTHGLHVHFAVGEYMDHREVGRAWGRGFVYVTGPKRRMTHGDLLPDARRVAGYVAKYLAKDTQSLGGLHRYGVAEGFQPRAQVFYGATAEEALRAVAREMGGAPARYWESRQATDWAGPPAVCVSW